MRFNKLLYKESINLYFLILIQLLMPCSFRKICRCNNFCPQRGRVVRSIVFTMAMIARLIVQLQSKPHCWRPWIRRFTTNISAKWNLTSSKFKKSEVKFKRKTPKQRQFLSETGFVLCIAPSSLSRDRRIKMKKSSIKCLFHRKKRLICFQYPELELQCK